MKTDRRLKIIFGALSLILLVTLLYKLTTIPGGMILPGWFLGGMLLIGVLIAALIVAGILKVFFKKSTFFTLFTIITTISLLFLHYYFYSPKLILIVPNNYYGEINLVKSNTNHNILTVDHNGIDYLTKWTFNKLYLKPTVIRKNGKNIEKNLVGFNPSTFFGLERSCCIFGGEIESLTFEIVPDSLIGQDPGYATSLLALVNKKLITLSKQGSYSTPDTVTVKVEDNK